MNTNVADGTTIGTFGGGSTSGPPLLGNCPNAGAQTIAIAGKVGSQAIDRLSLIFGHSIRKAPGSRDPTPRAGILGDPVSLWSAGPLSSTTSRPALGKKIARPKTAGLKPKSEVAKVNLSRGRKRSSPFAFSLLFGAVSV